eukprot:139119-Chlamydomonas_euryale.AAC.1
MKEAQPKEHRLEGARLGAALKELGAADGVERVRSPQIGAQTGRRLIGHLDATWEQVGERRGLHSAKLRPIACVSALAPEGGYLQRSLDASAGTHPNISWGRTQPPAWAGVLPCWAGGRQGRPCCIGTHPVGC